MLNKNDEFHSLSEDIIFKYIFGCKKNIRFTTWLLESLFNLPQNSLKDNINIENSLTLNKTKFLEKGFELDIKISMPSGWIINLEMYQFGFRKKERIKSLMYIMHIMSTGLDIGHNYEMAKKHLQINFIIDKKYPSGTYLMLDKRNNKLLVDDLIQVDVINIDNYKDSRYDVDEDIKKLFLLMKARSVEEEQKIVEGSKILTEMQSVMERFRKGEFASEYFSFINVQKSYHAADIEHTAQMKLKEGRNIGRLEGEKQKALSTARNLIKTGKLSKQDIAAATGLKESDIAKIKIAG